MTFEQYQIILKDGSLGIIRSPKIEDAEAIIDLMHKTSGETDFLMSYPEERSFTVEDEENYLKTIIDYPSAYMMLCEIEGKVVAMSTISWSTRIKIGHRASIGIMVLKDYWNIGIGTKMFEKMIEIAEACDSLIQIELDYIEGNNNGRGLYEKMGFKIVGIKPNAIRLKDGTLLNEYSMIKELKR